MSLLPGGRSRRTLGNAALLAFATSIRAGLRPTFRCTPVSSSIEYTGMDDLHEPVVVAVVHRDADHHRPVHREGPLERGRDLVGRLDHEPFGTEGLGEGARHRRGRSRPLRHGRTWPFPENGPCRRSRRSRPGGRGCTSSRTAVSSSPAEYKKPPSPEIEITFSPGRTRHAAMAQGRPTPRVCCPLLISNCRGRKL